MENQFGYSLTLRLRDRFEFCSDGAVKRLRNKIRPVCHRLRHAYVPLLSFLGREGH